MYCCERCKTTFDEASKLTRHLSRQVTPCDFFCNKCGIYLNNRRAYIKHISAPCFPKPIRDQTVSSTEKVNEPVLGGSDTKQYNVTIQPETKLFKTSFVRKYNTKNRIREIDFDSPNMVWLDQIFKGFIEEHEEKKLSCESLRDLIEIIDLS